MARQKIKISFIPDDSARRTTYRKRKKGLLKKASELNTLCGITSCVILYSAFEARPVVWPSVSEAKTMVARFGGMAESQKMRKMLSQKDVLRQRIAKAKEQMQKQREENRRKRLETAMWDCLAEKPVGDDMSLEELKELIAFIREFVK